ncbi:MAG: rhodanese-like domain-containing protein [Actinobacteria bacterium]|nr:rhodanese-like domain-containing protein [Actinomycetota bacterium]
MFKLFSREPQGYANLSPADVKARLVADAHVQLIDVRSPGEFSQGHIPKAKLIPLNDLPRRHQELKKSGDIILYCLSAARSKRGALLLVELGYENVYNMEGGISRWPFDVKQ